LYLLFNLCKLKSYLILVFCFFKDYSNQIIQSTKRYAMCNIQYGYWLGSNSNNKESKSD